jgi:hypothetical protein
MAVITTLNSTQSLTITDKITNAVYLLVKDAPLVFAVSLVAHSCFAVFSLGLSTPFSAAVFAPIVLKGVAISLFSNSVWNVTAAFFNFSLKRTFTWFSSNEKLRSYFNSKSDQFFFGTVIKSNNILFGIVNGIMYSQAPFTDLKKHAFSILKVNLLFLSIATVIFTVISSLAIKVVQGPASYVNRVIDNHLNNEHLSLAKKEEFRDKMKGATDEFIAQTSQLVILDLISSPNPTFPTFVGEIKNIKDATLDLRTSFQALNVSEKEIIENRVRLDPTLGKLRAEARDVWNRIKNLARNSLSQNNGYFDAAVKHALIHRSN